MTHNPLIVALDVNNETELRHICGQISDTVGMFKVGLELFSALGGQALEIISEFNVPVFLDLKLHDIPTTVGKAVFTLAGHNISMLNVHAMGGLDMMIAAKDGLTKALPENRKRPKLIAVTVLTSSSSKELSEIGIQENTKSESLKLAALAKQAGLDGVVCAPEDAAEIKKECGSEFITVCPGIRPAWAAKEDQVRIMTPREAVDNGADYIVVGRPVTKSEDMRESAKAILEEVS